MNAEQEKIFNAETRVMTSAVADRMKAMVIRILAASTPALPGEVRLPSDGEILDFFRYTTNDKDALVLLRNRIRELNPTPQASTAKYACDRCGKMRTKEEGGTTFTVCDECWNGPDKEMPPPASTVEEEREAEIEAEIEVKSVCEYIVAGSAMWREGMAPEYYRAALYDAAQEGYLAGLAGASRRRVTDEKLTAIGNAYFNQRMTFGDLLRYGRAVRDECEGKVQNDGSDGWCGDPSEFNSGEPR